MTRVVEADYLVVGAGAMGMAFTDALIDHADVRVALVDRADRHHRAVLPPRDEADPTVDDEGHAFGYLTRELDGLVGAIPRDSHVGEQFLLFGLAQP